MGRRVVAALAILAGLAGLAILVRAAAGRVPAPIPIRPQSRSRSPMATVPIAVANRSTVLTDREVAGFAAAFQVQVARDFAPLWGVDATARFFPKKVRLDRAHWWLVFLDDADQAGALGYHDVTPAGLPIGKAFARTAKRYGDSWSVTGSHEGLEMLGDPHGTATTPPIAAPAGWDLGDVGPISVILEDADAVEDDSLGYEIDGLAMSNFVTREWFDPKAAPGSKFDFGGRVARPLELLPGGYISYRTADGSWNQVYAQDSPLGRPHKHARGPAKGSRLERLLKPRHEWRRSTAEAA